MITTLWIIFIIWAILALTCVYMVEVAGEEIFGFIFLISLPIMFYVPFLII